MTPNTTPNDQPTNPEGKPNPFSGVMGITCLANHLLESIKKARPRSGGKHLTGVITSGALLQDIYLYFHGNKKDWFYFDGVPFEVIQDKGIGWGIRVA